VEADADLDAFVQRHTRALHRTAFMLTGALGDAARARRVELLPPVTRPPNGKCTNGDIVVNVQPVGEGDAAR
jgi:hypothetical protein